MSDSKISALTAAASAAAANEFAINEAGTSKKVTAAQIKTLVNTSPAISGGTIDNAAIGGSTPAAGAFTTVAASGAITSTLATGNAPLVVASTTNVANLNASSLSGATMSAPGAIGGGTPAAGTFTVLTASTSAALTSPTFAAGSATAGSWPVHTPGSTLLTAAVAGTVEVDANCFYLTTDAGNRGYVPVVNLIRQHADRAALGNNTNVQAIFDSVTNGTLTLETGCYLFDAFVQCKGMSATSGNMRWSLLGAGGATLANILQQVTGHDVAVDTQGATGGTSLITELSTASVVPLTVATVCTIQVRGSFELTVAGTIIPSVALATAVATAVITAGSYFRIWRVGSTSVVSVGQWT